MADIPARRLALPLSGYGARLLDGVKTAFRALRRRRAADARWEIAVRRDLAHLDHHQLRDIGLDRDAM